MPILLPYIEGKEEDEISILEAVRGYTRGRVLGPISHARVVHLLQFCKGERVGYLICVWVAHQAQISGCHILLLDVGRGSDGGSRVQA